MSKTKNTCQTIKLNDNRKEDVRERGNTDEVKMGKGEVRRTRHQLTMLSSGEAQDRERHGR